MWSLRQSKCVDLGLCKCHNATGKVMWVCVSIESVKCDLRLGERDCLNLNNCKQDVQWSRGIQYMYDLTWPKFHCHCLNQVLLAVELLMVTESHWLSDDYFLIESLIKENHIINRKLIFLSGITGCWDINSPTAACVVWIWTEINMTDWSNSWLSVLLNWRQYESMLNVRCMIGDVFTSWRRSWTELNKVIPISTVICDFTWYRDDFSTNTKMSSTNKVFLFSGKIKTFAVCGYDAESWWLHLVETSLLFVTSVKWWVTTERKRSNAELKMNFPHRSTISLYILTLTYSKLAVAIFYCVSERFFLQM